MASSQIAGPSLDGKVALVTGASRGIGRAIAQRFAAAGATVIVVARSLNHALTEHRMGEAVPVEGTLEETVALIEQAGGRAIALACDLDDAHARAGLIDRAVEAAGRLDILVNNAGFAEYVDVEHMPDAVYTRTVEHYLTVPFVLSRAAIPIMKRQGAGWILNLGSVSAEAPVRPFMEMEAKAGLAVYAAVKAAIHRLTQGMAVELADSNIAVNLVSPSGAIRTPGASGLIPDGYPGEPVEYLANTALDLVHAPASERTGVVAYGMHYAQHHDLPVTSLDGRERLGPPSIPEWSHPGINPSGIPDFAPAARRDG